MFESALALVIALPLFLGVAAFGYSAYSKNVLDGILVSGLREFSIRPFSIERSGAGYSIATRITELQGAVSDHLAALTERINASLGAGISDYVVEVCAFEMGVNSQTGSARALASQSCRIEGQLAQKYIPSFDATITRFVSATTPSRIAIPTGSGATFLDRGVVLGVRAEFKALPDWVEELGMDTLRSSVTGIQFLVPYSEVRL